MTAVRAVGVVVPAHDEQELLPACLSALAVAAARVPVPVDVVVVLDACTDASAAAAAGWRTVEVDAASVGAARRAGMADVLARLPPDGLWLASTDADSVVSPDWLARQLAHARAGADAVLGTVVVADWSGHPAAVRQRYRRAYRHRDGHPHVHGANLGLSAPAYLDVGGFPPAPSGEDVSLAAALTARRWRVRRVADLPVTTSARTQNRAPGGFGELLRGLSA